LGNKKVKSFALGVGKPHRAAIDFVFILLVRRPDFTSWDGIGRQRSIKKHPVAQDLKVISRHNFSVDSVLIAEGCFRGVAFDSGLSIQDRERASQARIAHDRFAAPGAFLNAVTLLAVRMAMGDLKVVSA